MVWLKIYDNMLNRFHLIPERLEQTDRIAISINIALQCAADAQQKAVFSKTCSARHSKTHPAMLDMSINRLRPK